MWHYPTDAPQVIIVNSTKIVNIVKNIRSADRLAYELDDMTGGEVKIVEGAGNGWGNR